MFCVGSTIAPPTGTTSAAFQAIRVTYHQTVQENLHEREALNMCLILIFNMHGTQSATGLTICSRFHSSYGHVVNYSSIYVCDLTILVRQLLSTSGVTFSTNIVLRAEPTGQLASILSTKIGCDYPLPASLITCLSHPLEPHIQLECRPNDRALQVLQ